MNMNADKKDMSNYFHFTTKRYKQALLATAALLIMSQLFIQLHFLRMETDANIIKISGHQRMLSQKIAKAATSIYMSNSDVEAHESLEELIAARDLLKKQQEGLINGSTKLNLPVQTGEKINKLYKTVDESYQLILKSVGEIENIGKNTQFDKEEIYQSVLTIQTNEKSFLEQTDKIVSQFEEQNEANQLKLRIIEVVILIVALSVLAFVWKYVFKSTQKKIEEAYKEIESNEQYLSLLFDTVPTVTLIFDAFTLKVIKYNSVAVKLLKEWLDIDLNTETSFHDLFKGIEESENMNIKILSEILTNDGFSNLEVKICDKKTILMSAKKVQVKDQQQHFIVFSDISFIKHAATIDSVTQMLNRRSGLEHAEFLFNRLNSTRQALTICFLDIDGLKTVNDTFGHHEGDCYIKTVAKTVLETAGDKFKCMRYGGDEILLMGIDMDVLESKKVLEEIESKLQKFSMESTKPYEYSISYGISSSKRKIYRDVKDLIEEADDYMYEQKKAKKLTKKLELQVSQ
ncbi:MAG: diguanylate cyclase protein [Bacillales bacterium]|nr:diguanylate cyclase protein [Bacillales bacterium]